MKDIYVYIDESMNPNPNSYNGTNIEEKYFLLGMLVTDIPFPIEPINKALEALRVDPDHKTAKEVEQDTATLSRRYFHASFDSKNAHSWLCHEINDLVFPLKFHVIYWDKSLKGADDLRNESDVHKHVLNQLLSEFSFTQDIRINVFVARRSSFAHRQAADIIGEITEGYVYSASQYAYKATILNDFKINIVEGDDPGVQICDFILWTFKRKILDGNNTWHERLSDSRWIKFSRNPSDGFPFGDESLKANGGLKLPHVKAADLFGKYIKPELWLPDDVNIALQWVEFNLRDRLQQVNQDTEYLRNDLKEIFDVTSLNIIDDSSMDVKVIDILSNGILLLIDTLPLQDLSNPVEMKLAQIAKGFAAIVMDRSNTRWIANRNYWCDLRKNYFTPGSTNLIQNPL